MRPAAALAQRLGLAVRDNGLVEQALVHSSWLHEHPDEAAGHNERLELLGDAVINLAISDALYAAYPGDDEGLLSARRAAIVSAVGLARLAHRIDLGPLLFLGEGEAKRGARRRPSLLASTFEALAGALFLDIGWEPTRAWLVELAAPEIAMDPGGVGLKSPKSRLQEFTQRRTGSRPVYHVVDATGPDHEKQFRVEVTVEGRVLGSGGGPSRRVAETAAAVHALDQLRREQAERTGGGSSGKARSERASTGSRDKAAPPGPDEPTQDAETARPGQPSQWSR
ncbi:MAG TPA: ribonuclease III [Candidatus Limnocylindrales bacterium]|nr:ribonuclease III [Candidatus Limnocylindrales bacterium]